MLRIVRYHLSRLHKNYAGGTRLIASRDFCDDSKNNAGDKPKEEKSDGKVNDNKSSDAKSATTLKRLNELLALMSPTNEVQLVQKVQLAKPAKQRREKAQQPKQGLDSDSESDDDKSTNLAEATRAVANAMGGDPKKTEAELLAKLLGSSSDAGSNLGDVISGMQIDKGDGKKDKKDRDIRLTRSNLVRKSIETKTRKEYSKVSRDRQRPSVMVQPTGPSVKLFEEEPLNIFTDPASLKDSPDILDTWKRLQDRELRLAVTHPPANYFQKMALWSEQGKLWKFPIDNEQGLDEEAKVSFTDHIFLEEHLESWCPTRGPVRHFMELVCVGLSKNYFITAQEKKEHILWFRDYFEQKKDLLQQVIVEKKEASGEKQIET
ncbi:28S ribosomal protein S31, mitochondrial [Sabethes cyaneus]|uniref:28S ribosomal protein S31, mitochondrial n=1 Tax=Sabethes cyaneus TaxID=53552 RepID=UPI00237E0C2E|nr:28S ribosomal protein S31, mitochondrial [Sabethes cyaneus]